MILGVVGNRVENSLSPKIFEILFRTLNHNIDLVELEYGRYKVYESDFGNFLKANIYDPDFLAFNITVPFKNRAISFVDNLSQDAVAIGNINLIKKIKGTLFGYNSDWFGFYHSCLQNDFLRGIKDVVLIGAGATASSILYAILKSDLIKQNINIILVNRTFGKAEELKIKYRETNPMVRLDSLHMNEFKSLKIKGDTAVINATSISYRDILSKTAQKHEKIFDVNYFDDKYPDNLINGLDMLIFQAVKSFDIIFDLDLDSERERELFLMVKDVLCLDTL